MKSTRILSTLLALTLLLPSGAALAAEEQPPADGTVPAETEAVRTEAEAGPSEAEAVRTEAEAGQSETETVQAEPVRLFTDFTSEHWAYDAVARLTEANILNGYPDGSFRPDGEVTVEEFSKMLAATFQPKAYAETQKVKSGEVWWWNLILRTGDFSLYNGLDMYSQTPDVGENPAFYLASNTGWMKRVLTRQEMAQMMYNVVYNVVRNVMKTSTDDYLPGSGQRAQASEQISDWTRVDTRYRVAVSTCYVMGLLNGIDGEFQPRGSMTRAQASVVVCRLWDLMLGAQAENP